MKLVDKIIMLTRMIKDYDRYKLDVLSKLQSQQSFYTDQKKYVKDKNLYEQGEELLEEMQLLHKKHDEINKKLIARLSNLLRTEEVNILRRDYDRYDVEERSMDLMLERAAVLDDEFIKEISKTVGYYSDWRWAGVELNPSNGKLTHSMLACDPLYVYRGNIVDTDSVKNKFNKFFAEKRLMFCDHFNHMPQQQLGLAVSINCYDFWPIDPIKQEMKNVYNILKPGGHYIFTYTNCELEGSLHLLSGAEQYRSYNTRTLMENMVKMLGFDIASEKNYREAHSWMVVKKPGELTSQKLTAPLVTIKTTA